MNKRGNGTIGAVFIGFIILVIVMYTAPTVEVASLDLRESDIYNCKADPSYNASLETNTMGCGITALASPIYVLGAIALVIMMIMFAYRQPDQQYGQPQY